MRKEVLLILVLLLTIQMVFSQQVFITSNLPNISRYHSINIQGNTIDGAQVEVYVNDKLKRREPKLVGDTFLFRDIILDKDLNTVKLLATDKNGLTASTEKEVLVDTKPAELTVDFPKSTLEQRRTIKGRVSEKVTLNSWVTEDDGELKNPSSQEVEGEFSLDLNLPFEKSKVILEAVDRAGHKTKLESVIIVDTKPPTLKSNLDQFKYVEKTGFFNILFSPEVKIKGSTDEPSAITVYVNDKPQEIVKTDKNNNFEVKVKLSRDLVKGNIDKRSAELLGTSWTSQVKLVAIDDAGRESSEGPVEVVYSVCGKGGPFRIIPDPLVPDRLNPRLLLQGLQTAGFGYKLEYIGAQQADIKTVRVVPVMFRTNEGEGYDQDWITPANFFQKNIQRNGGEGFVNVKFKKQDPKGDTDYAKEKVIAEHNQGKCLNIPYFGCVKFYLQFVIEYTETYDQTPISKGERIQANTEVTSELQVQKTCDRYEIAIDQVRPEKLLPKTHLKKTINILDDTVKAIDAINKPLKTVNTYLTYACVLGKVSERVTYGLESWDCKWNGKLLNVFKDPNEKWDPAIAEAGLCEEYYSGDKKKDQKNACSKCENSIKRRKEWETKINTVCDRLAGPAAPTLQKYLTNHKADQKVIQIPASQNDKVEKWRINNEIYVGNDCSFEEQTGLPIVEKIYQNYKTGEGKIQPTDCKETMRPAHPVCCGQKYMDEWGSACGIPGQGIDTFNELKESACLAANKEGQNKVAGEQCYQLWNSVAGFCDPKGGLIPQTIFTGVGYSQDKFNTLAGPSTNSIYVIIIPKGVSSAGLIEGVSERSVEGYRISLGYVANKHAIQKGQNNYYLNAETVLIPQKEITSLFFEGDKLRPEINANNFRSALGNVSGSTVDISNSKLKEIYDKVRNSVGTIDQSFIVRPDSGLLRSVQCVFLPGIIGWLDRWRDIAGHAKACLQKIVLTGDGTPGTCQEFLSKNVCDFAFDALSCAAQKYVDSSPSGGRIGGNLGVGNIFGAISDSNVKTQNSLRERYGETSMWKNLFTEKRVQNSVCAFAFTGTWDLDVESIAQMSTEKLDLPSQALLSSCRRTFGGYVPTEDKNTKGLTTWIYDFAAFIMAGSDVRWWTELKCSEGYRCDPADGYTNGRCDCDGIGEKTFRVQPRTVTSDQISKGEIMDEALQVLVKSTGSSPSPNYRYDKAVIHWESTDPSVPNDLRRGSAECSINLVGGDAPAFCQWSMEKGAFWCAWGQQRDTIKLNQRESKPSYPHMLKGKGVFGLGDTLSFNINGVQKREEAKIENAKYLLYKIDNKIGRTVREVEIDFSVPEKLRVDNENVFTKEVQVDDLISQEDFGLKEFYKYPGFDLETNEDLKHSYEDLIRQLTVINAKQNKTYAFVFDFNGRTYEIYKSTGTGGTGYKKGEKLAYTDSLLAQTGQESVLVKTGEEEMLQFNLAANFLPPETEHFQVLVQYPEPSRTVEACGPKKPVDTWWAEFKAHVTDENGVPTEYVAIDEDGNPARISIPFNVVCVEGNTLEEYRELSEAEQFYQKIVNGDFAKLFSVENGFIYQYTNFNAQEVDTPREFLLMTQEKLDGDKFIEAREIQVTKREVIEKIERKFYLQSLSTAKTVLATGKAPPETIQPLPADQEPPTTQPPEPQILNQPQQTITPPSQQQINRLIQGLNDGSITELYTAEDGTVIKLVKKGEGIFDKFKFNSANQNWDPDGEAAFTEDQLVEKYYDQRLVIPHPPAHQPTLTTTPTTYGGLFYEKLLNKDIKEFYQRLGDDVYKIFNVEVEDDIQLVSGYKIDMSEKEPLISFFTLGKSRIMQDYDKGEFFDNYYEARNNMINPGERGKLPQAIPPKVDPLAGSTQGHDFFRDLKDGRITEFYSPGLYQGEYIKHYDLSIDVNSAIPEASLVGGHRIIVRADGSEIQRPYLSIKVLDLINGYNDRDYFRTSDMAKTVSPKMVTSAVSPGEAMLNEIEINKLNTFYYVHPTRKVNNKKAIYRQTINFFSSPGSYAGIYSGDSYLVKDDDTEAKSGYDTLTAEQIVIGFDNMEMFRTLQQARSAR